MTRKATDAEWLEWIEVQKQAARSWLREKDVDSALRGLRQFLAGDPPTDLRREAISFRSSIREDQGDLNSAKEDLLEALRFAERSDHVRFELEDSISVLSTKLGEPEEAERWYSAALRTAAADPRVAGGGFLLRFLRFRGERGLSDEELRFVRAVVHQSWHLLLVQGEPDFSSLVDTARKLVEAQRGPFSAERSPAPKKYVETGKDDAT